jgi:bacterioferritin (cytochrome b1)
MSSKEALHPYLQTIMGNLPPTIGEGEGSPDMEPPPEPVPPGMTTEQPMEGEQAATTDMPPQQPGMGGQLPPEAQMLAAMGQTPGMPDPNDPLRNTKDEGVYSVDEMGILEILSKILTGKYAILIMYYHYGATMLSLSRDSIYKHFLEHAKEERESAYMVAKLIVAMGGQAAPKVGPVRPAVDMASMFSELLKAEQKVQGFWRELNMAAGQNLGLQAFAQDQCQLDFQHANDLRRWIRSEC